MIGKRARKRFHVGENQVPKPENLKVTSVAAEPKEEIKRRQGF